MVVGWVSVAPDLLFCGNTPVASVLAEEPIPTLGIAQLRKTNTPSSAKTRTLGPASGGAFLCVQTLGTISRVPGFALVRKNGTLRE